MARVYSERVCGTPFKQVVGTAGDAKYGSTQDGSPLPAMLTRRAGGRRMTIWRILTLSAGAFITSTIASHAGPCSQEIDSVQARVDARLAATVGAGSSAPESPGAKLHRQPTPDSVAAAQGRAREMVTAAMARAREADQAGDMAACRQALAEVQAAIGP